MAIALDQQFKIEKKGILEQRTPILHESGMQHHYFISYVPAPIDDQDPSVIEQWIERMTFIIEDLTWLLQQNHTKFWCEVAFSTDFRSLLDSYLRYAPRVQRAIPLPNYFFIPNGKQIEENVSRLMFLCILRLSTHKESNDHFFTPQGYGNLIYSHYIFDVPRLLDICALYAVNNQELLSKMIGNIFKQQPKYYDDLKIAIDSIKDVISSRMKNFFTPTGSKKVQSINKSSSIGEMIDLLYYMLDLSSTINRFITVYPEGRTIFYNQNFHFTLVEVFETLLRSYQKALQSNELSNNIEIFEETKYETVTLINDLISSCCINSLINSDDKSDSVEALMKICQTLITEKRTLAAFEDYFELMDILELAQQTSQFIDEKDLNYYQDAIRQAIELYGTPSCKQKLTPSKTNSSVTKKSETKISENPNVEIVQNLFPDLSEKYIEACLKYYNDDTNQLINALFDKTVPENRIKEQIQQTSTEHKEKELQPPPPPPPPTISSIQLVEKDHVDDESNFFNEENIALGLIHRGKKNKDNAADLNDKSFLTSMREKFSHLSLVEDISDGDYDDEYDDTYDDGLVNVQDKDDMIDKDLPKNENRIIGKKPQRYRDHVNDDDDDDETEENSISNKRRDQFVENPEAVRERWAQQRAAWQERHQPNRAQQPQDRDVVGGKRGRGQSTTVVHNRRWKDANKSSQANHHRRDRAAQKLNRGLLS